MNILMALLTFIVNNLFWNVSKNVDGCCNERFFYVQANGFLLPSNRKSQYCLRRLKYYEIYKKFQLGYMSQAWKM